MQKRGVSLVTITLKPTCTCTLFRKTNKICPHLLFTLVCVLGVSEDSPLLEKYKVSDDFYQVEPEKEFSEEDLENIFSNAPRDTSQLPRLAPNQMIRAFHGWFDPNIKEIDRRKTWETMCIEEEMASKCTVK